MRFKIVGAGYYGLSIATGLIARGHEVEIHELRKDIMMGASGNIPARLHLGAPHYPRSHATQRACAEHQAQFLGRYAHLTRNVPINIYAIAKDHSLVDFGSYRRILKQEIECITIHDPAEYGLQNVEGAMLTAERHIVTDKARAYFWELLRDNIHLESNVRSPEGFDFVIDCTFCAGDSADVDRYEPCLVLLLRGPTMKSVTVMDGKFPSLYNWDEDQCLSSLSSAQWTPFSKTCKQYAEAKMLLDGLKATDIMEQGKSMIESMRHFYPAIDDYKVADMRTSIRAMPLSGSDSRLCDVRRIDEKNIRVRAGKIDAVIAAELQVIEMTGA